MRHRVSRIPWKIGMSRGPWTWLVSTSILVATAYRGPEVAADPIPHALVLTGIVVAVSATALGLALERRRRKDKPDD